MDTEQKRNRAAYRLATKHYWRQMWQDKALSIPSLLLTGIGTVFVLYIPPLIIARLLDRYAGGQLPPVGELTPYIAIFAGSWLTGEMFWRLGIHLATRAEMRGVRRLYTGALNYMLEKDMSFFHDNFAGSLTKKTVGYSTRYVDIYDTFLFNVFPYIVPTIFISVVLWRFSPLLVLTLLGMTTLIVLLAAPLIRYRKRLVAAREAASNKLAGHVSDVYTNFDAVTAFAREAVERKTHGEKTQDFVNKMQRSWDFQNLRVDMLISPFYVATNALGLVLALHLARTTGSPVEVVFLTFTYFTRITTFLWEFNSIYRRLETAFSDASQFTELLLDEPKVQDVKHPQPIDVSRGEIEFRDVTFDHEPEDERDALFRNFGLHISPGEKIGLVGHSGGGKSTLTKLIMRLMDIDGGKILIDGQNIALARQTDLRQYLSYVPQDPVMFHRSIAENISYGKLEASRAQIEEAAKNAHAHEFIQTLPEGYETLVGERGVKLSGGQRQRIAIARAMLKDAPVLLLDEATSALDSESEKYIQQALWRLMKGKTAIVIAHRLSTIQKMDRIIVLDKGEIAEEGTHHELLGKNGIYAKLWAHQSGGFIEE